MISAATGVDADITSCLSRTTTGDEGASTISTSTTKGHFICGCEVNSCCRTYPGGGPGGGVVAEVSACSACVERTNYVDDVTCDVNAAVISAGEETDTGVNVNCTDTVEGEVICCC